MTTADLLTSTAHLATEIVKVCSCGRRFRWREWIALESLGFPTDQGQGVFHDWRNCPDCHSTLIVELNTYDDWDKLNEILSIAIAAEKAGIARSLKVVHGIAAELGVDL